MPLYFAVLCIKIGILICTFFQCFLLVCLCFPLTFCWICISERIQGFLGMILMNRSLWGLVRGTKVDRHLRGKTGLCWWMSFPGELEHRWDATFPASGTTERQFKAGCAMDFLSNECAERIRYAAASQGAKGTHNKEEICQPRKDWMEWKWKSPSSSQVRARGELHLLIHYSTKLPPGH